MTFTVKRGDATVELHGTPQLKEVKDPFGNAHQAGRAGNHPQDARPAMSRPSASIPRPRCGSASRKPGSWSIGRSPISAASSPGAKRPTRSAARYESPRSRGRWPPSACRAGASGGRAVDIDRAAEPVPGTAARWRSPFVLCGGSRPRAPFVGTGAGNGVPNRARSGADADGVCDLQRHPAFGGILKRLFCDVANRQRLGMKMKLHCIGRLPRPAKLATSRATDGNLPVRGGAVRHWNDKGALRMNFGMRVRGGLFAALIMFAVPVAATLAGVLVSSPAAAQTVASIQVEGNRRVEVETIRSYFKPGPGGRLDQAQIDDGLKALIETGLFQDVKISQVGGHLLVTVVENPVIGRVAFEGNKKIKDEQLSAEVQSKPRGTLSRPMVQSDAQRIAEIYRHSGRYDVRVNPRNHRTAEQPRRSRFRDHRRRENRRQVGRVRRQQRLFVVPPEGHHQDPRIEPAELPRRRRRLRSGPGRSRPRPDSPLLSEARFRRRAGGGRADGIRSAARRASW